MLLERNATHSFLKLKCWFVTSRKLSSLRIFSSRQACGRERVRSEWTTSSRDKWHAARRVQLVATARTHPRILLYVVTLSTPPSHPRNKSHHHHHQQQQQQRNTVRSVPISHDGSPKPHNVCALGCKDCIHLKKSRFVHGQAEPR